MSTTDVIQVCAYHTGEIGVRVLCQIRYFSRIFKCFMNRVGFKHLTRSKCKKKAGQNCGKLVSFSVETL